MLNRSPQVHLVGLWFKDQSYLNFTASLNSCLFKKYTSWTLGRLLTRRMFLSSSFIVHWCNSITDSVFSIKAGKKNLQSHLPIVATDLEYRICSQKIRPSMFQTNGINSITCLRLHYRKFRLLDDLFYQPFDFFVEIYSQVWPSSSTSIICKPALFCWSGYKLMA